MLKFIVKLNNILIPCNNKTIIPKNNAISGIISIKSKKDLPTYLFNLMFDSKVKELYIKNSEKDIIVSNKTGIMYISILCPPTQP